MVEESLNFSSNFYQRVCECVSEKKFSTPRRCKEVVNPSKQFWVFYKGKKLKILKSVNIRKIKKITQ